MTFVGVVMYERILCWQGLRLRQVGPVVRQLISFRSFNNSQFGNIMSSERFSPPIGEERREEISEIFLHCQDLTRISVSVCEGDNYVTADLW